MSIQFDTVAEAMAWMQQRHGIAKGINSVEESVEPVALAASNDDPKDKPVAPPEGDDEPAKDEPVGDDVPEAEEPKEPA